MSVGSRGGVVPEKAGEWRSDAHANYSGNGWLGLNHLSYHYHSAQLLGKKETNTWNCREGQKGLGFSVDVNQGGYTGFTGAWSDLCAKDLALRKHLEQKLVLKGTVRCPWHLCKTKQWVPGFPHLPLIYQKIDHLMIGCYKCEGGGVYDSYITGLTGKSPILAPELFVLNAPHRRWLWLKKQG